MRIDDIRRLDGGLLLVFRELLRHGSATVASRHLGLTQPAVSHALGRLRLQLGDPLFVRRPHGLEPTDRARELAPVVESIIELAGQLHRHRDQFDPVTSERTFRLAAPEFVTATIGGALLGRWREHAPQVAVEIRQLNQAEVRDKLTRGRLDLAIGRFPPESPSGLHTEPFYEDEYCVVARRDHPTIRTHIDNQTYLASHHVLAAGASETTRDDTIPEAMHILAVVPAWLTALAIVATSDAIATCPRHLAEQHSTGLGLRTLPLPQRIDPIVVRLQRRSGPVDPGTAWLTTELRHTIRETHAQET